MPSFDYTSRDYLSIKQDILDRASVLVPEWTSRNSSDFGMVLVDLWAYIGDILHYYVDRAAAETYLETATQKSSVLAIANLLDYRPLFQTSSSGTVTISATNPTHSDTIVVPVNTGFVAPATDSLPIVYFTSTTSASMGPSVSSIVVSVEEGKYQNLESPVQSVTRLSTSNGTSGQRFNLRYTGAIASSVVVYVYEGVVVDGAATAVQYRYTSALENEPANTTVFGIEVTADGVMQILFGNGVNGKIPNSGAEVKVSYRYGKGVVGNISSGRVTQFDSGSQVTNTTITSSSAMTGGTDSESVESMKANIPLLFRTQDRAVSLQDFKDLALRVPQVAKATCTRVGSTVTVYGVPYQNNYEESGAATIAISSLIQSEILKYFESRTVIGASVVAAPSVTLTPINITATIYVKPEYVAQWVKDNVEIAIKNLFKFESVSFGQTLSLGEVYRTIYAVEGVDYATISVFSTTTGVSNTVVADADKLLRRGTLSLTTSGGITGTLV